MQRSGEVDRSARSGSDRAPRWRAGALAVCAGIAAGCSAGPLQADAPQGADPRPASGSASPAGGVTFSEVYSEVIESGGCGSTFCHGGGVANLAFADEAQAYQVLVRHAAEGSDGDPSCASLGLQRVAPGDAQASLLYRKLAGTQPCGSFMPPTGALPAEKVELVKRWIEAGAPAGRGSLPQSASLRAGEGGAVKPPPMRVAPVRAPGVGDWAFFGYDAGNTRYNRAEKRLSAQNVPDLRVLWSVENIRSGMYVTPAVVGGVLYYADRDRHLYAVDAKTGEPYWETPVGDAKGYGEVNGSPLVAGERVYVGAVDRLYAFDRATGKEVWRTQLDVHPQTHIFSNPVLAGNKVVIGVASHELVVPKEDYTFHGSVVAVNKDTGAIAWRVYTAGPDVKASDGSPSGDGVSVWSSAAVDPKRKLAFIGTGQSYEAPASERSDALLAIHYETGELAWSQQFTENDVYVDARRPRSGAPRRSGSRAGPGAPAPVPAGDAGPAGTTAAGGGARRGRRDLDVGAAPNLFVARGRDAVGVGSKAGIYKVFDRETGEVLWSRQLEGGGAAGGISSTAAVGDGVIYVNSNDWRAYQFTRGGHSPRDTSRTYALDADSGETLWETQLPAPTFGYLMLANGVVYQGLVNGLAVALAASDGRQLWSRDLGHDMACGFSLVDGVLYGGSGGIWEAGPTRPGASLFAFTADEPPPPANAKGVK